MNDRRPSGHADTDPAVKWDGRERRSGDTPTACLLAESHERLLHGHGEDRGVFEQLREIKGMLRDAIDSANAAAEAARAELAALKAERWSAWERFGYFAAALSAGMFFAGRMLREWWVSR